MVRLLIWLAVIEPAFVWFGVLACSSLGMEKRPHFWVRVLLGCLAMLSLVLLLVAGLMLSVLPQTVLMLIWLVLVITALIVGPTFCYSRAGSSPGSSETDGGGGSDPDQPPSGPNVPRGGIPLPDADQAIARARDHNRPRLRDVKSRRRGREPRRTPTNW